MLHVLLVVVLLKSNLLLFDVLAAVPVVTAKVPYYFTHQLLELVHCVYTVGNNFLHNIFKLKVQNILKNCHVQVDNDPKYMSIYLPSKYCLSNECSV